MSKELQHSCYFQIRSSKSCYHQLHGDLKPVKSWHKFHVKVITVGDDQEAAQGQQVQCSPQCVVLRSLSKAIQRLGLVCSEGTKSFFISLFCYLQQQHNDSSDFFSLWLCQVPKNDINSWDHCFDTMEEIQHTLQRHNSRESTGTSAVK